MGKRIKAAAKLVSVGLLVVWSLAATAEMKLYYVHNDHLNTPQLLTDENQNVVWAVESQTPFGEVVVNEDPDGDGESVVFNVRFPGQYFDGETGLSYNYYRTYDASLGRYVQSDPVGLLGGVNTFGYVKQNPISGIDPYGLFLWPWEEPFNVSGGTADQRTAVVAAANRVFATPRGTEMMDEIHRSGDPVYMRITDPGVGWTHVRFSNVIGSPQMPESIFLDYCELENVQLLTTEEFQTLTLEQFLAHEMGHFVFRTFDVDVNSAHGIQRDMQNVIENENPVRRALGDPERCSYYSNATACEPGF